MAPGDRLFPRGRFLKFPLDHIESMEALMAACLRCARERRTCRIMGISGPVVAMGEEQPALIADLERFDVIVPDGRGIELFAPLLGVPCGPTLPLPDVAGAALELAHRERLTAYILGATAEVNARARANLAARYPGLRVEGRDGYFTADEDEAVAAQVRAASPDIMLLAMPTPKKERFMLDRQEACGAAVAIGCGGYIDTVAGLTKLPAWVSRLALSWLVRVAQEPRKLWRRIFVGNLRFVGLVAIGTLRRPFRRR